MSQSTILTALHRLLRPLVRILLRKGISVDVFESVARRVYVEIADRDFVLEGRKQTVSRIGVLTGLNRKEVARLRNLDAADGAADLKQHNRAERVLTAWLREDEFLDEKGDPRILPFDGDASFTTLVKRFSGDMPARAVADELMRVGSLAEEENGQLRLRSRGYVPAGDDEQTMLIFGVHTADLIETFDRNISAANPEDGLWQREVTYSRIPQEHAREFKQLSARWGQQILEEMDRWLAAHNATGTDDNDPTVRLGFGLYQIETDQEHAD